MGKYDVRLGLRAICNPLGREPSKTNKRENPGCLQSWFCRLHVQLITVPIGGDMKISKEQLIEKLIPEVLNSLTLDDLRGFVASSLDTDYRNDFDMLVEDALAFKLIQDEEEIE